MISLSVRSDQKELLDADNIPFADIKLNLQELNTINRILGGHRVTLAGIRRIISSWDKKQTLSICEIGCGGGDNLMFLNSWCKKNGIKTRLTGIDIKQTCISFCIEQHKESAEWICSDFKNVTFQTKPDILFSSLFCHHFNHQELAAMVQWMKTNCKKGFIINDLHRHILAYYSICLLTGMFSKSYLVKNDAPVSVKRGFKKKDWEKIFADAGFLPDLIQWKWAFRYLVIYKHSFIDRG